MLLKILLFSFVVGILVEGFMFFKFDLPMFRFKVYYAAITSSYKKFEDVLEQNEIFEGPVHYQYSCLLYKYKLNFWNSIELASQLEKHIDEALMLYQKLGTIANSVDSLRIDADNLRKLRLDIRIKQRQLQ